MLLKNVQNGRIGSKFMHLVGLEGTWSGCLDLESDRYWSETSAEWRLVGATRYETCPIEAPRTIEHPGNYQTVPIHDLKNDNRDTLERYLPQTAARSDLACTGSVGVSSGI